MPIQEKSRKPHAPDLPLPIHLHEMDVETCGKGFFLAASLLNKDGELQAIEHLQTTADTEKNIAIFNALYSAWGSIKNSRDLTASLCQEHGGLPFAFHRSAAFAAFTGAAT